MEENKEHFESVNASKKSAEDIEMLKQAAEGGDLSAMFNLAMLMDDDKVSFEYLLESARKGYIPSMSELANAYKYGLGTPIDPYAAYFWFKKAGENGIINAYIKLAFLCREYPQLCGEGESELLWHCKAIENGIDPSFSIGVYQQGEDAIDNLTAISKALQIAAGDGFSHAKRYLAEWSIKGIVSDANPQLSLKLYKEAADEGDNESQYQIALFYLQEHELLNAHINAYNPDLAAEYLELAANKGHVLSQYKLGLLYSTGQYFPIDKEKSIALLENASYSGLKMAEIDLARVLGEEVNDYVKTLEANRLISFALSGVAVACAELSKRYANGTGGVDKDEDLSSYWQKKYNGEIKAVPIVNLSQMK